jgi:hypothetical protein
LVEQHTAVALYRELATLFFPPPPSRHPPYRQRIAGSPRAFRRSAGAANPGPHGYDQLDVAGTVNLTRAKLDFHGHSGETFEILGNDSSDPMLGHFAGLAEGAHVVAGGKVATAMVSC